MRVVIAADNPLSAEAIRRSLDDAMAGQVVGFVSTRRPLGIALTAAAPHLAIVDGHAAQPEQTLERLREARETLPTAKVLLLTVSLEHQWLREATAAGADAVIARTLGPAVIGLLVREIAAGRVFHSVGQTGTPYPARAGQTACELTDRELQILTLVARGASNAAIARSLWVTEQTVKFHLSNVYRKLGVANRTQASHYAHTQGLLGADGGADGRRAAASAAAAA